MTNTYGVNNKFKAVIESDRHSKGQRADKRKSSIRMTERIAGGLGGGE